MSPHRYTLEKGSKKHICPGCNKKTFVRYIDTSTREYLPEQYGRCDRESKCAYHLNPYKDGYSKAVWKHEQQASNGAKFTPPQKVGFRSQTPMTPRHEPKPVFFDFETFKHTLQPERYQHNTFIQNLLNRVPYPFEIEDIEKVVEVYRLGTIAKGIRAGAVTFPFIDIGGNVRTIQVKNFDQSNRGCGNPTFLHSLLEFFYKSRNEPLPEWLAAYLEQDKKVSCLFGEHLLSRHQGAPVALVEAPKTAVYGWLYFNQSPPAANWLWLAVYNKSSFSFDKLKVLKGRTVYVFPDLSKDGGTFREWEAKARDYEKQMPGTRFIISDLLEQYANDQQRDSGADIADILILHDWRKFRPAASKEITNTTEQHTPVTPHPKADIWEGMDEVTKRAVLLLMDAGFELIEQ
jgi:hypothetical protein